ncbi:hypothetical protein EVAR_67834_1 [Eumeta japonica]|uniref:Uncharacterized protein n=1 Tax=Eumeta variegata TaxID=151549 RepID=A0A4C1TBC2_EUMVA|nr:hypothetical protein EVAR_67834_1 [Eumeta japonica]
MCIGRSTLGALGAPRHGEGAPSAAAPEPTRAAVYECDSNTVELVKPKKRIAFGRTEYPVALRYPTTPVAPPAGAGAAGRGAGVCGEGAFVVAGVRGCGTGRAGGARAAAQYFTASRTCSRFGI